MITHAIHFWVSFSYYYFRMLGFTPLNASLLSFINWLILIMALVFSSRSTFSGLGLENFEWQRTLAITQLKLRVCPPKLLRKTFMISSVTVDQSNMLRYSGTSSWFHSWFSLSWFSLVLHRMGSSWFVMQKSNNIKYSRLSNLHILRDSFYSISGKL